MRQDPTPPVLVVGPTVGRADTPVLRARLADLLTRRPGEVRVVVCDVSRIVDQNVATLDTLARLRLTARRLGVDLQLRGASLRLRQLLTLTGLDAVIPVEDGSGVEPHREAEQREQPLHVEEVGDPADPPG
ncbi:STAS domain-containing protein [Plantactinospora sp. B24E8]|uniref:STAS domain-containing protein n=1 Tax=Plantactinospora sp. B24E8 TaxID=3153567 RepID=UPI00325CD21F